MEERESEQKWQVRAARLFCILIGALVVWLILKYATVIPLIILVAWAVAAVIDPLARKTEKKLGISRKLCAAVYVILLLTALGLSLFLLFSRLIEELRELVAWMGEHPQWVGEKLGALVSSVETISSRFPFLAQAEQIGGLTALGESIDATVSGFAQRAVSELGALVTTGVGNALQATPRLLVLSVVTVMSCFYWSMDYERIRDFLLSLLPPSLVGEAERFRQKAGKAIRRYLRAYGILWLLTLGEVFVGLLILKQPYAFLIALAVATVDVLPVLGAGAVLIPWAVVMFLLGRPSFAIGLLILYGILTVVRQIAEPHLVGESLGIHPLASLLCMALGLQLFGVVGMFLGPVAALLIKEFLEERKRRVRREE